MSQFKNLQERFRSPLPNIFTGTEKKSSRASRATSTNLPLYRSDNRKSAGQIDSNDSHFEKHMVIIPYIYPSRMPEANLSATAQ